MESRSSQSTSAQMKAPSESIIPPFCQPASIATQASSNASNVAPGTAVGDQATVTGTIGAGAPLGTVQFSLCGPMANTSGGCPSGAATLVAPPVTPVPHTPPPRPLPPPAAHHPP